MGALVTHWDFLLAHLTLQPRLGSRRVKAPSIFAGFAKIKLFLERFE